MITLCIYYCSNSKAESKMFAPNRHDRLIDLEANKTGYSGISFKEYIISQFHRIVLY